MRDPHPRSPSPISAIALDRQRAIARGDAAANHGSEHITACLPVAASRDRRANNNKDRGAEFGAGKFGAAKI
jgi:hypothetical protein